MAITSKSSRQSAARPPITGQTKGFVDEKKLAKPLVLLLEGDAVAELLPVVLEAVVCVVVASVTSEYRRR